MDLFCKSILVFCFLGSVNLLYWETQHLDPHNRQRRHATMIVYFSGTGNSRYCAQLLAHRLGDDCMDTFSYIRNGIALELISSRPWVFVAPTYGWQLPRVFIQLLRTGLFSGCRDAYFVMTCGSDIGCAGRKNRDLCQTMGLTYRGTLPVIMPENYIAMFSAPQPQEAQAIIAAAQPALESCAAAIQSGKDISEGRTGILDHLKSGAVNQLFYRFCVKAKPFTVSDACISCGKCVQDCPLGNIRLSQGKPVWGTHCTHCMACICSCPTQAIEYGRISRGKPRYQCPEYRP